MFSYFQQSETVVNKSHYHVTNASETSVGIPNIRGACGYIRLGIIIWRKLAAKVFEGFHVLYLLTCFLKAGEVVRIHFYRLGFRDIHCYRRGPQSY